MITNEDLKMKTCPNCLQAGGLQIESEIGRLYLLFCRCCLRSYSWKEEEVKESDEFHSPT